MVSYQSEDMSKDKKGLSLQCVVSRTPQQGRPEDARRLLLIIDTRVSHASSVSAVSLGLQGLTSSKTTYSRAKSSSKFGPSAPSLTCDYFTETLDCMLVSVIDQASKGAFKLKCLVKLKSGIR